MNVSTGRKNAEGKPGKIAIIGMSCLFPGAPNLATYWSNIVGGVDATREVTDREWRLDEYYDSNATTFGKSYSKRGGFITEHAQFDALKFGVMPSIVAGSDPDQLLTLKVAQEAMADAGYLTKQFDRDRAEIIIGRISAPGAGCMNLLQQSKTVHEIAAILRTIMPDHNEELLEKVAAQIQDNLVPITSDTIPGAMPNVLAGRLAAKLGFRGRNMLIDAACASSMVAVETAVNDLLDNRCDFALAGGVHINSSAVFFQMFCGLGALSRTDSIRPFDQMADGTMLGEGVGMICLKRLEDALTDGDRIYATVCGVASSSDGHGGSVLAPNADGEALAMRKAYAMADISPSTIELLEAHGTGTPTGDVVEMQAVAKVFNADKAQLEPWCAVGSVKSMIGHCQSASAVAGIIKTALALHHKILPPTLNVTKPNTKIDWANHPCYVNSQTRPWVRTAAHDHPRRAAVSAFGFGGINGHMIMEEHGDNVVASQVSMIHQWESELFTLAASSREALIESIIRLAKHLDSEVVCKDLAYTLNCKSNWSDVKNGFRLAIVANSAQDLLTKLKSAAETITDTTKISINETKKGIYFTAPAALLNGTMAFLYPGLGSAYTNMLGDLCVLFPEIREVFEIVDNVALAAGAAEPPSKIIFPPPFTAGERTGSPSLATADFAVVAVLLAEYALYQFLHHLEIKPDVIMGCSTGEFAAITTGGSVDVLSVAKTFYQLSTKVARSIPEESLADLRSLRVLASAKLVMAMVAEADRADVHLSADLGEEHTIVTGTTKAIENLNAKLREKRMPCHLLPVAIPYHTPLVDAVMQGNEEAVNAVEINRMAVPSWSCSTAKRYPDDIEGIRAFFTELFTRPVALRETISAMYASGVRKFIEVGPSGVLSSLIAGILPDQAHIAVPTNLASKSGLTQMHHLLASLFVQEVPAKLDYLYQRRAPLAVDWHRAATVPQTSGQPLLLTHAQLVLDAKNLPTLKQGKQILDDDFVNNADDDHVDGADDAGEENFAAESQENVVERFLSTNASFYSRISAVSEQVMRTYIENAQEVEDVTMFEEYQFEDGAGVAVPHAAHGGQVGHTDYTLPFEAMLAGSLPTQSMAARSLPAQPYSAKLAGQTFSDVRLPSQPTPSLPFLDRCRIFDNEENTEVFLTLNLATDLYLLDHAIGGTVSVSQNTKVSLVPLMVSLEIMAEAALARFSESASGHIVKLEQVKAFRRLVVDENELSIRMIASGSGDRVHVEMTEAENPGVTLMMADFVFAANYEAAPPAKLKVAGNAATNLTNRTQLYSPQAMFHGPSMQAVISLDQVGNKAIAGRAEATAAAAWMPDLPQANFLIHPLLLDNASQFVLFYLYENQLSATALLPFFIESIDFYADPQTIAPQVQVSATLPALTERATEAEVEVISNGKVAIRVNSINSRRVTISTDWQQFVANPTATWLGESLPVAKSLSNTCVIMQVSQSVLNEDDVILEWCLDYLLTKSELTQWRADHKTKKRKMDWLLGRIAAKEAVRMLVRYSPATFGRALGPHDIEIKNGPDRAPFAVIKDSTLPPIQISISHTDGKGFAIATLSNAGQPGIDAEAIETKDSDFAASFMQVNELKYLENCKAEIRDFELTRIWAAKEAMYKANKGSIEASKFELAAAPEQDLIVMTGGDKAGKFKTYCSKSDSLVLAYTLSEPA